MDTLRQQAEQLYRSGSPRQMEALMERRDKAVEVLRTKPVVDLSDIDVLDRLGRFSVAKDLFQKCSARCRSYLLNDEHPHVRSAAIISARTGR